MTPSTCLSFCFNPLEILLAVVSILIFLTFLFLMMLLLFLVGGFAVGGVVWGFVDGEDGVEEGDELSTPTRHSSTPGPCFPLNQSLLAE